MRKNAQKYEISNQEELKAAMAQPDPRSGMIALLRRLNAESFIRTVSVHAASEGSPPPNAVIRATSPRFVLPLAGAYRLITDPQDRSRDFVVETGRFHWVRPGDWVLPCNESMRTLLSVVFYKGFTRFFWYHHPGDGRRVSLPPLSLVYHTSDPMSPGLRRQVEAMTEAVKAGYEETFTGNARALLGWCLRELINDPGKTAPAGRQLFTRISHHVGKQLEDDLGREAVARHFGISPGHLTRLFRQYCREGFNEYVRRERLELATRLLWFENLSVKQIGSRCGFSLTAYFIKLFREQYGVTPNQYRRQLSKKCVGE